MFPDTGELFMPEVAVGGVLKGFRMLEKFEGVGVVLNGILSMPGLFLLPGARAQQDNCRGEQQSKGARPVLVHAPEIIPAGRELYRPMRRDGNIDLNRRDIASFYDLP